MPAIFENLKYDLQILKIWIQDLDFPLITGTALAKLVILILGFLTWKWKYSIAEKIDPHTLEVETGRRMKSLTSFSATKAAQAWTTETLPQKANKQKC